jgi:hypothetical protein
VGGWLRLEDGHDETLYDRNLELWPEDDALNKQTNKKKYMHQFLTGGILTVNQGSPTLIT